MFLQAGFNPRTLARRIAYAMVRRLDRRWTRPAELFQLECGDFAWYGGSGRVSWGEQLRIVSFFRVPLHQVPKVSRLRT